MFLTAFILGIAGSLHCAGMCSPLSMTVTNTRALFNLNRLVYHLSRITMYGILGTITAGIGYMLPLTDFQNLLSIILGVLLVIMASIGMTSLSIPFIPEALASVSRWLKKVFSRHINKKTPGTMILLGSLNGLLPCGLTFLAVSFCITLSKPLDGFIYMFIFGIGTMPVMLGVGSIMDLVKNKMQWNIKKVTTGLMMLSGVLLIVRVFFIHQPIVHNHEQDLIDIVICR